VRDAVAIFLPDFRPVSVTKFRFNTGGVRMLQTHACSECRRVAFFAGMTCIIALLPDVFRVSADGFFV
jgi:hypothetical protein